ncbi:MAG TPA: PP2C family serine/threonine-protein phosphatase [Anaerolineales bacterium]|nr:PP2C family serine/threonine-protein phosphatase [Anaerolineales bacterium]
MKFIAKLFGRNPKPGSLDVPTKPLSAEAQRVKDNQSFDPPQLIVGCSQSVGQQREHNEDSLFTLATTLTSDYSNIPFGLFMVADGMGGHQYGELASGIAIRTMAAYIVNKLYTPLLSVKPTSPEESLQEIMQKGIYEAHRTILHSTPGGGTTLTAALILGKQLTIAHVGDSRAYLVGPNGSLEALTRDHSLVNRLVELGQITTAEAAVHPQRNVLYRALGQGEPFDPDMRTTQLPEEGYLLLCSDGLWGVVPEAEINHIVTHTPNPELACKKLVEAANAAGGPDNITAVLVRLPR